MQDPESAILISVESRDARKAAYLENRLPIEISELVSLDISQVYSQIIPIEQIDKRSEEYGVSFGVLNLARMAHEKYPEYSMEELFGLPVSVLYEMAHSEPGSYQPEFDLFDEHGGDGQPYKIILPIISNSSGLEATPTPPTLSPTPTPSATCSPTVPVYYDDDWDDD